MGPSGGPAPAARGPCTAHGRKHREAHRGAERRQAAIGRRTSAGVRPADMPAALMPAEDRTCGQTVKARRAREGRGCGARALRRARARLQAGVVAEAADGVQVAPQQAPQLARCQVQHLLRAPPPSRVPHDRCMRGAGRGAAARPCAGLAPAARTALAAPAAIGAEHGGWLRARGAAWRAGALAAPGLGHPGRVPARGCVRRAM